LGQIQLARAHVLIRVKLDFLEADDARGDMDLSMAMAGIRDSGSGTRWFFESRIPSPESRLKGVQDRDLRIRDRVGIVIALDLPHVRLAAVEVQLLHLVQR